MLIPFLLAMLAATLLFFFLSRAAVDRVERHHYLQRADLYRYTPVKKGDIVFLGDSITDGGCWDELFPGLPVKNRGINGDDTIGLLNRLEPILYYSPKAIFLLIGTNDLNWWAYRHDDDILATYDQILDCCKAISPATKVFVQSILPRAKRYSGHIRFLNDKLKLLANKFGYEYIDLFPHFANGEGALKSEYTNDNLHLMSDGYKKWVEILSPFIDKIVKS
jgi:lysophospholipase L1-like esterase